MVLQGGDLSAAQDLDRVWRGSQYARLCEPTLEAAGWYSWAAVTSLAALLGFVAAWLFLANTKRM